MRRWSEIRTWRVGYQGGPGCHSERAGMRLLGEQTLRMQSFASFADATAALANARVDLILLPVFNSTTGPIPEALHASRGFTALDEIRMHIEHFLMAVPDARRRDIRTVWAHPQVALQCRNWIARNRLELKVVDDGARQAPAFLRDRRRHVGVLGPVGIGKATGLYPLEGPVQDQADNHTTFRLLARADHETETRTALTREGILK